LTEEDLGTIALARRAYKMAALSELHITDRTHDGPRFFLKAALSFVWVPKRAYCLANFIMWKHIVT